MGRLSVSILARPTRPEVLLCAFAPLPELVLERVVTGSGGTNQKVAVSLGRRRRIGALAPIEEPALPRREPCTDVMLRFYKLRRIQGRIAEILKRHYMHAQRVRLAHHAAKVADRTNPGIERKPVLRVQPVIAVAALL